MLDSFSVTLNEVLLIVGGLFVGAFIVASSMIQSLKNSYFGELISKKLFESIDLKKW